MIKISFPRLSFRVKDGESSENTNSVCVSTGGWNNCLFIPKVKDPAASQTLSNSPLLSVCFTTTSEWHKPQVYCATKVLCCNRKRPISRASVLRLHRAIRFRSTASSSVNKWKAPFWTARRCLYSKQNRLLQVVCLNMVHWDWPLKYGPVNGVYCIMKDRTICKTCIVLKISLMFHGKCSVIFWYRAEREHWYQSWYRWCKHSIR